jgi:hypothetical protein
MNFLLIPDNFGFLPKDDIYEDALKLLASHNLKQADIVFLHGALDVQLPPMANKDNSLYDSSKWLGLAKLGMFGGHVHKPFTYKDKFWSSGSFDRTAHGEMHPKGAYEVLFNKEKLIPNFYENKNALIYDVIDINVKTTREKLIETLNKYLAKRPMDNSHIRIRGGSSAITSSIINDYKERFPQYNFDLENEKEDNIEIDDTLYTLDMYKGTSLDKNNIESNLFKFMESTLELNPDIEKDLLSNLLNEVMDE